MPFNFILVKNNKKTDKAPDYRIVLDNQDKGACWVRESKKGKFLSCLFDPDKEPYRNESRPDNNDIDF